MALSAPVYPCLCTDAACSGNPGILEFRAVAVPSGEKHMAVEVFHRGPYQQGTNNVGEFLALVLGLAYLKKYNLPWTLYTDSVTAIAWVRARKCKSKVEWGAQNQDLLLAVRSAEKWLHDNTWTTPILKWETPLWGEIPADFGRK